MPDQIPTLVHDVLSRKIINNRASRAVVWGSVNVFVLAFIMLEIYLGGLTDSGKLIWWTVICVCIVCFINSILHIKSYLSAMFPNAALQINEKQKNLLSVIDQDYGFKIESPNGNKVNKTPCKSQKLSDLFEATFLSSRPPATPEHNTSSISTRQFFGTTPPHNVSYLSNTSNSPDQNYSLDYTMGSSVSANSWSFHGNNSILQNSLSWLGGLSHNDSVNSVGMDTSYGGGNRSANSPPVSPFSQAFRRSEINNKDELNDYLKDFNTKRRNQQILSQNDCQTDGSGSFWSYSSPSSLHHDQLANLKKIVYHPATKVTDSEENRFVGKSEESAATNPSSNSVRKVWQKRNIAPTTLFTYEENLRIWMSMNILTPLVGLIDSCNESLQVTTPELKIGNIGIDKLKKASLNITGMKQLNSILPFLDMTLHQDYLVQRLRELARGGAMSAFQWNSGGKFNGQSWRDEFPTDSYILLHLFALYMDTHLPPDPTQPDGRVFSNVHLVKTPEKPPKPASYACLYLTQLNPPHLKVVLPGEEECEVGSGHKNCLHALLLFFHHIVHQEHSHIAGINLKLSGINLAWVVAANSTV